MILYIDKENIKSILMNRDEHPDLFYKILSYVRNGVDVQYNFSKEELKNDIEINFWFRTVRGLNVSTTSYFFPDKPIFPQRPLSKYLSSQLFKANDGIRSVYMISGDENIINNIKKEKIVLIANKGEEYNIIKKLSEIENKKGDIISVKIESWEKYCPKAPVTDIILCDEHYFINKNTYTSNNNELLTSIALCAKTQINIVIITNPYNVKGIVLKDVWEKIKNQINNKTNIPINKCNVTIVTTSNIHSRHLITNYYRINHTSCFHLKDNGLKKDVTTSIVSNTSKTGYETTNELIQLFNKEIRNGASCYGDQKSNLLKFK